MKIWCMFLLVFLTLKAFSQDIDTSQWILIDCGATIPLVSTTFQTWQIDESYIKTGTNQIVLQNYPNADTLNTLRSFPNQNKNCYTLPTLSARYFIRAAFYYGNYDRKAKPPTFDLEIDGNKWTTVETSLTEAVYNEVIYTSKGENVRVCLARTKEDEYPFISTLEAWPIDDVRMYPEMSRDLAWLSSYRYNYGANYMIVGYNYVSYNKRQIDKYNRIWIPPEQSIPNVTTIASYGTYLSTRTYEYPPDYAILDAIEADDPTKSIVLSFNLNKANSLNYIEVYFTELETLVNNEVRSLEFYVDGHYELTTSPQYGSCSGAIAFGPSNNSLVTVELRPAKNSTLPPIVSAVEVYTASDPLVTVGTSQDDLDGLAVLISTFVELEGWSGEPCLPSDTVWEWLGCNGTNPPRVTSIKLSGYGLEGALPDFSTMQDLESIDMSNNRLNGQIPEWLGKLPRLKLLNLKNNDFSGDPPDSIRNNKDINFSDGNTNHNMSKTVTIIALAIGIPLAVILITVALLYFLIRKNRKAKQDQIAPQVENGSANDETIGSTNTNAGLLIVPSVPSNLADFNDDVAFSNDGNDFASNVNIVHGDESSMVPDMDMDELEEMLNRQGSSGPNGRA